MYITQISDLKKFTTKTGKVSFFTSRMNFTNKNNKRTAAFVLSILSSSPFLSFQFSILPIRQGINPIDKPTVFCSLYCHKGGGWIWTAVRLGIISKTYFTAFSFPSRKFRKIDWSFQNRNFLSSISILFLKASL